MTNEFRKNAEGYTDPTASATLGKPEPGDILDDIGNSKKKGGDGDPEFLHTKHNLAITLKGILGDSWPKYQELFPMLHEYWNI